MARQTQRFLKNVRRAWILSSQPLFSHSACRRWNMNWYSELIQATRPSDCANGDNSNFAVIKPRFNFHHVRDVWILQQDETRQSGARHLFTDSCSRKSRRRELQRGKGISSIASVPINPPVHSRVSQRAEQRESRPSCCCARGRAFAATALENRPVSAERATET